MSASFIAERGSGTTSPVTITAAASGNTIVLFCGSVRGAGARQISSLSCTNVTWNRLSIAGGSGGMNVEIWTGSVSGGSSGTSITVTMSGTGASLIFSVLEFSGPTIPTSFDAAGDSVASGTSSTAATGTPWNAVSTDDLLLACEAHLNGTAPTAGPTNSWNGGTFRNNSTTIGISPAYRAGSQPNGAHSTTWTLNTSLNWAASLGGVTTPAAPSSGQEPLLLVGVG